MDDTIRVIAGDCTITYDGTDTVTQRGAVLVLYKPDDTVLVHDADGYQPAAWLTRADTVRVTRTDGDLALFATKDDATLHIRAHTTTGDRYYPCSPAGPPVGDCVHCPGTLIETTAAVVCTKCRHRYPVPRDATITDATCPDCTLPRMTVERGATFELCIDDACTTLADVVADQFDAAWPCPNCDTGMTIDADCGVAASCPSCDTRVGVPRGTIIGECPCGAPLFGSADATRCLDPNCTRRRETAP